MSYNRADKGWAEWIAWTLEDAGHEAVIQAWDFRPGGNFVLDMQRAAAETEKTILVLSENYLASEFAQPEWASAFADDPTSLERRLIPVRVQVCEPRGLLRPIVYVDIVGVEKETARQRILEALPDRLKPDKEPNFPMTQSGSREGIAGKQASKLQPDFPNPRVLKPWTVPYERNAFFTGREKVLAEVRSHLTKEQIGAIAQSRTQAISGLGGIGKTQTAVEYAYRYRDRYTAVFWVRAETLGELQTGFVEIARELALPGKDSQDPSDTVRVVRDWLAANPGWLLIFDNADTPTLLKDFRPRQNAGDAVENKQSHLLLTSRAQTFDSLGISRPVSLAKMPKGEAIDFLLKRTGRTEADDGEKAAVIKIVKALGYLPLALEQAGAYILAQKMTFANYLKSYGKRRLALLQQTGPVTGDYPESVATTWALNFQAVEQASQASADLLRVSAFLSPDAIPYELFEAGASELGDVLATELADMADDPAAFADVLAPLTRYSLVQAEPAVQAYSVARLVQEVLKAELGEAECRRWAEYSLGAVAQAFPTDDFENWSWIDRLLTHARATAQYVEDYPIESETAATLLGKTGGYLYERGLYDEADPLYCLSLALSQKLLDDDHPAVATRLNNLALLYSAQGRYSEAEPL
ncbi:MAG: toll/interleukin-1 receptor domain-containing protein, partial [Cyanobacteria bacterium J06598_3]